MAPVRVCVSGAAGQIGYALVCQIARGDMFGETQPVVLHLLEGLFVHKVVFGFSFFFLLLFWKCHL